MPKDIAASVRQRLVNLAKERREDFNFMLIKYGIERLLYRLSISGHSENFILKGATLFSIWNDEPHRPTRDIDFLGYCDNDPEAIKEVFVDLCAVEVDDGLVFDAMTISVEEIKEDADYTGIRVKLLGFLQKARANVQVDIGFGDIIVPEAQKQELPTLLDFPAPVIKVYPVYSVVSEKLEAMYSLGEANSRMKDFYDLWNIANGQTLDDKLLHDAVIATFAQRNTEFTAIPIIFEESFIHDAERNRMWKAYLKKLGAPEVDFSTVISEIQNIVNKVESIRQKGNT